MKTLFISLLLILPFVKITSNEIRYISLYREELTIESAPLTMENVIRELVKCEIENIDIVVRQIIWETGWLKSNRAINYHNLFGFEVDGKGKKFAKWEDSVKYYKQWQMKKYKGGDYYSFLTKVGYAQDVDYIKKLQSLSTKKFKTFYT